MDVPEFLAQRDVLIDVDLRDKAAVLHRLAQQVAGELELNAGEIEAALIEREKLGSTGTGGGIAIPHARLAKVKRPIGAFARTKKPIGFEAIDEMPVDLVFLLLLPAGNEGRYLSALASVARRLRNPATQASCARRARKGISLRSSASSALAQALRAAMSGTSETADQKGSTRLRVIL